ncbi:MAG: hypothetical protein J0M34_05150 [Alphaproteobacteria bacterium]|nr:hypothetical protein [Alphaproteobacteria bacterium]
MSTEKTVSESSARAQGEKPIVTTGQHIHKWSTYLSVDWVFNTLCGVGFAYGAKYTKIGQKLWSGPIQKIGTKLLNPFFKNDIAKGGDESVKAFDALKYSVDKFETFFSIIAGGMFTIPPLMVLEDKKNRIGISRGLDEMIHGKEKVANDPRFEASYKAIEQEPTKDFAAGMTSRFAALAPLLAWVLIPKSWVTKSPIFKPIIGARTAFFGKLGDVVDGTARKMGFSEAKLKDGIKLDILRDANGEIKIGEVAVDAKEKFDYITRSATPMDFGLGLPYAGLHAIFYSMFAGGKEKKPEKNSPAPARHTEQEHVVETTHTPKAKVHEIVSRERMAEAPKLEHAVERA